MRHAAEDPFPEIVDGIHTFTLRPGDKSKIDVTVEKDGFIDVVMAGAFDSAWSADMGMYNFNNVIRVYKNGTQVVSASAWRLSGRMRPADAS